MRLLTLTTLMLLCCLPVSAQQVEQLLSGGDALCRVEVRLRGLNGNEFSRFREGVMVDSRGLAMVAGRLDQDGKVVRLRVELFEGSTRVMELPGELLFYDRATEHSFVRLEGKGAETFPAVRFGESDPPVGSYVYSLRRAEASHDGSGPLWLRKAMVQTTGPVTAEGHRPIGRTLHGLTFAEDGQVIGLFKEYGDGPSFVPGARLQRVVEKARTASFR